MGYGCAAVATVFAAGACAHDKLDLPQQLSGADANFLIAFDGAPGAGDDGR